MRLPAWRGVLAGLGVEKGSRVVIYMPMVPETAIAMLACARIGAVHSVVFGGFASNELAVRIEDAKPVAIITASCGLEPGRVVEYKPLVDKAIEISPHKPSACIVLQRPQAEARMIEGRDHDWHEVMKDASLVDCVPGDGNRPALHHLHLWHYRPTQRVLCVTMAGISSLSNGR